MITIYKFVGKYLPMKNFSEKIHKKLKNNKQCLEKLMQKLNKLSKYSKY